MNVLEIIRAACGAIGIPRPNSIIGSADSGVVQLLELLNEEGSELASRSSSGWQALVREATFVTVALEDQGTVDSIIGAANAFRHILNETIWNRTRMEPIYGPRNPSVWQGYKAVNITGPYPEYRIRGGHLLFLAAPAAGETCAFEYATKNWLISEDGSEQRSRAIDDEDEPLLDDELVLAGIKWRWRAAKGLEYGEQYKAYESRVIDALSRDGTKPRLSLGGDCLDGIPVAIPAVIGS